MGLAALVAVFMTDAEVENHRRECEAREVMRRFRTPGERVAYFSGVEKRRGFAAAHELKQEIARQAKEVRR